MKKIPVLLLLLFSENICFSQPGMAEKKEKQEYKIKKITPKNEIKNNEIIKKGPSGIGSLKLGMTKDDIEILQEKGDTYLQSPLVESSVRFGGDVTEYITEIKIPISIEPIKTKLNFRGNSLFFIELLFEERDDVFKNVLAKIAEKYGDGLIKNGRKDELCLYQGGANFKIETGIITTQWIEEVGPNEANSTVAYDSAYRRCPKNLKYNSVYESINYSIIFMRVAIRSNQSKDIF